MSKLQTKLPTDTWVQIVKSGSRRITESQVLPGLAICVLREALEMSRTMDQAQVGAWLMSQFKEK